MNMLSRAKYEANFVAGKWNYHPVSRNRHSSKERNMEFSYLLLGCCDSFSFFHIGLPHFAKRSHDPSTGFEVFTAATYGPLHVCFCLLRCFLELDKPNDTESFLNTHIVVTMETEVVVVITGRCWLIAVT
jgi:hypothetical protein